MYRNKIPEVSIYRLAIYLRKVEKLEREGRQYISSQELGRLVGIDPAQLRKDLSYFGQFGEVGKGYHISKLSTNLKKILKLYRREWKVALAGVGNLGSALISYKGFEEMGFIIVVAFDKDPKKVGREISGVRIYHVDQMEEVIRRFKVQIGIIAVPADAAQGVADSMVRAGVKSILNFAPVKLNVPEKIILRNVDLSTELMSIPYYIS
jgi:redox-sensing transcriptional repressor